MRDPNDKGHLIPNPETATIVKKIFKELGVEPRNYEDIDNFGCGNLACFGVVPEG